MIKFYNQLIVPFVILYVRYIQWRYKSITVNNYGNQTNQHITELQLLQAKEYYYKNSFQAWGRFHPSFSFTDIQLNRHRKFINWLFPLKSFKEWDIVVWYKPEAVTYYHNRIFYLNKQNSPIYAAEIIQQLKKWKERYESRI